MEMDKKTIEEMKKLQAAAEKGSGEEFGAALKDFLDKNTAEYKNSAEKELALVREELTVTRYATMEYRTAGKEHAANIMERVVSGLEKYERRCIEAVSHFKLLEKLSGILNDKDTVVVAVPSEPVDPKTVN